MKNFFEFPETARSPQAPELMEDLVSGPAGLRVERIVSWGQTSPPDQWYDQAHDEWVLVVEGRARLAFDDGREVDLEAGGHIFLPAGLRHRVTYTSRPCLWLAVHGAGLKVGPCGRH